MIPISVIRRLFALLCAQTRLCRPAFAFAGFVLAGAALAQPSLPDQVAPDVDLYALMSGKCSTLEVAGHHFACKAVGFFHSEKGRAEFTVALDDPSDDSHIISFSGEDGHRTEENLYVLAIDRMLLKSKDRPKADGLPLPDVELSSGSCRQLGNFAAGQVSSISCSATDASGKTYQLQFESDGTPITLRRVRQSAPTIKLDPFQ